MQQDILLWCVAAPAIISLAFAVVSVAVSRRWCDCSCLPVVHAVIVVTGWCLAVAVTLVSRQSVSWWPAEAWQQVLWPITLTSLLLALLSRDQANVRDIRLLVMGIGSILVAMIAMPSGEGWADVLPLHRYWMAAVGASGLLNLWLLDHMARRSAQRWVLWVALAGLGAPTILAASSYGGLAEWLVAAISATLVFAIASTLMKTTATWSVLYSVSLFSVAAAAAGRFYTYEEHPTWLYALILMTPSLIALVDISLSSRPPLQRVFVAIVISLVMLSIVAWFILGGVGEEQW